MARYLDKYRENFE